MIAVLLCFLMYSCGSGQETSSQSGTSNAGEVSRAVFKGYAINEKAEAINISATVTGMGYMEDADDVFYVDIVIQNTGTTQYSMSAPQRFHLLNYSREKLTVKSVTDENGNDVSAAKLSPGESISVRALFDRDGSFEVAAFTYTYDIMGFGIFTFPVN